MFLCREELQLPTNTKFSLEPWLCLSENNKKSVAELGRREVMELLFWTRDMFIYEATVASLLCQ